VVLTPRCWRQGGDDCLGNRADDGDKKPVTGESTK